jgi:hypothetical protein
MTNAKLLDKLRALTKNADSADKEHIKKLRKVLDKLKKRQRKLADGLEDLDSDHERQKVEQEIMVLRLQRQKGVDIYKQLKKEREARKK